MIHNFILQTEKLLHRHFTEAVPASLVTRPSPAKAYDETVMTAAEKKHTAALMRINHTGEVCAQALYYGQAKVARSPTLQLHLKEAAQEWLQNLLYRLS